MTLAATVTLEEAARRTWDVIVIGAGPAGSMAAYLMARQGTAVLLVDRAAFPRWKVCGCCLNGSALASLRAAGLGDVPARCAARPLDALHLAAGRRSARVPLAGGAALSREAFDAALAEAAIAAGTAFLPRTHAALGKETATGRVVQLGQGEREVRATARVVLAADGLGGQLLARAGEGTAPAVVGARIGAGVVMETAPAFYRPGTIFMACGPGGYVGLVRLEDDRLDLAAALDASFVRAAGGPGAAATRLLDEVGWPVPRGLAERPWRGTPALTRRAGRLAAGRVFVLGDAAGYVEPFTGEGMAWALAGAAAVAPLALRAIAGWSPALGREWMAVHRRVVGRRQLVCWAAAAVLRRPALARIVVAVLARMPALAAPVVHHLNRPSFVGPVCWTRIPSPVRPADLILHPCK